MEDLFINFELFVINNQQLLNPYRMSAVGILPIFEIFLLQFVCYRALVYFYFSVLLHFIFILYLASVFCIFLIPLHFILIFIYINLYLIYIYLY